MHEDVGRFLSLQLAGDRRGALGFVDDAVRAGRPAVDVMLGVVQEAQREIGSLWEQDRISVAQEHMATAISQLVLAHLYHRAPLTARNGRKVLIACVPGELHDFPARLVADALDLAGYDVRFLGADVPADDIADAVRSERPDLVALSITMPFNAPALASACARVRAVAGADLPIAVGGHACRWSNALAEQVSAHVTADDARELVARVDALFGTAEESA